MAPQVETPPIQARRVLVPVANPSTAPDLIRMAWKLAHPEQGQVLALVVTVSGSELSGETHDAITQIVDEARESGIPVELITDTAPSVARGILDTAREQGTTLMVLGVQAPPARGPIKLGPVVESIARTTPCDLVVYRNPLHAPGQLDDIDQVIMPVDGSDNARVAARLGAVLADVYDAQPTAVYVQTVPTLPHWFGLARIEASLTGLKDTREIQRQVIRANDVVSGILTRCDQHSMIVLGFSERSSLDRWIFGDIAQRMLVKAPGPVILAKRAIKEGLSPSQQLRQRVVMWVSPTLTPSERMEVIRQAAELSQTGIDFTVLMVVSSLLASFGLLQNSAAVIIGAMLVAPLMSPLMAFSVGLLQGQLRLMRKAVLTVLTGILIGLGVAVIIGATFPVEVSTSEMLARGRPSLLDMGVALASGVAGAFALARKDIPSALAGVAIAAALVPPLCTVGLALAFTEYSIASGAALLFFTNIVSISLAGAAVFAWLGIRPRREQGEAIRRNLIVSLLVLGVLALPLGQAFVDVVRNERDTDTARRILEDQFDNAGVIDIELKERKLTATVRSARWLTEHDVADAERAIEADLGYDIDLEITNWRWIDPSE